MEERIYINEQYDRIVEENKLKINEDYSEREINKKI